MDGVALTESWRSKGNHSSMSVFSITPNNQVAVFASSQEAPKDATAQRFASPEELAALAQNWPASRLVQIWNTLPGLDPVRRFTDRKAGLRRLWQALQNLSPNAGPPTATVRSSRRDPAHTASVAKPAATARQGTKAERVLALLRQPKGATLESIMRATGWQAHSVRGFVSGHVGTKLGLRVQSFQRDGQRVYVIK
jgi:hypothetical protein